MTKRDEPSASPQDLTDTLIPDAVETARQMDRKAVGRHLHDGILQDLTIAGLRLKVLHDQLPEASQAAVLDFSTWLRQRQAVLREYVAALGSSRSNKSTAELSDRAKAIALELNCALSFSEMLGGTSLVDEYDIPVKSVLEGAVRTIAGSLHATHIAVMLDWVVLPRLVLTHDGGALTGAEDQTMLRRLAGENGAALSVRSDDGRQEVCIDWAG